MHKPAVPTVAQADVEGCTVTLAWGAGFFVGGAVFVAFLLSNAASAPRRAGQVIVH